MDDDRELRITSGAVIGVVMLLLAMLPRDIRKDFVSRLHEMYLAQEQAERNQVMVARDFFLLAGCNGSRGYWQSLTKRELNKQHQRYCVPKRVKCPFHYDL